MGKALDHAALSLAVQQVVDSFESDGVPLGGDKDWRTQVIRSATRKLIYGPSVPGTKGD